MSTPATPPVPDVSGAPGAPQGSMPGARLPLHELAAGLDGALLLPDDPRYGELATPWNVAMASRPLAVVAAGSAADVAAAVRFARAHGLRVSVQATGHGATGAAEEALLVHTGALDECTVHPEGWVRIGAGVRWQQVLDAAAPHGLTGLCGSAPHVGVVGYTTGGGLGPMARTYGFASDRVRAFEVVTGDGRLRRATPAEEPELFWGLRGGKGALGVVTALEFDLVRQPQFYGGALYFDGADARAVLHAWRTWSADLPALATTSVALLRLPEMPMVPPPLAGRLTVAVRFAWTGDPGAGEQALAPLRAAGTLVLDGTGVLPAPAVGAVHSDPVDPMPVHEGSALLRELPAEAVEALVAVAGPGVESPLVIVEVRQLGGAAAAAPVHADALTSRGAPFSLVVIGIAAPPVLPATEASSAAVVAAMAPWSTGRTLPNFAPPLDRAEAARVYDPATLDRLRAAVGAYDPDAVIAAADLVR